MNGSAISLLVGVFIGTYLNNLKFKSQIDNGLREITGKSIDALNNLGGVPDVPTSNATNTAETNG